MIVTKCWLQILDTLKTLDIDLHPYRSLISMMEVKE
jgi:hypothetical protein